MEIKVYIPRIDILDAPLLVNFSIVSFIALNSQLTHLKIFLCCVLLYGLLTYIFWRKVTPYNIFFHSQLSLVIDDTKIRFGRFRKLLFKNIEDINYSSQHVTIKSTSGRFEFLVKENEIQSICILRNKWQSYQEGTKHNSESKTFLISYTGTKLSVEILNNSPNLLSLESNILNILKHVEISEFCITYPDSSIRTFTFKSVRDIINKARSNYSCS